VIGQEIGQYRVVEQIGLGGMATVYKAYQASMDRYVALKVLPHHFMHDPTFLGRFEREAHTIARLEHMHILPVYDYGHHEGVPYLVMRYVEGGALSDLLRQHPHGLPLDEAARLIGQIASALDYAHEAGVIHRDVKPSNVLLDKSGNVLLTDFGIAKIAEATVQLTGSGIIGTPAYMSPEQGVGKELTPATDVYSLGVMLYEMLTGRVPFVAETPIAIINAHIYDPLPLPHGLRSDLPEAVERILLKALAKAPGYRYQTAGEMAAALSEAVRTAPVAPPGVTERAEPAAVGPTISAPIEKPEPAPPAVPAPAPEVPPLPKVKPAKHAPVVPTWAIGTLVVGTCALLVIGLALGGVFAPPAPTPALGGEVPSGGVTSNDEWTPHIEEFDGVQMALVPAGCFMMGSTEEEINYAFELCKKALDEGQCAGWFDDEKPQHQICFDEPFWIDVYEVTNAQYGESGRWSGDDLPRESIDWFSAAAHCEARGARLPSEAEWEYAARGPDGLIFPWGDSFDSSRLNFCDSNCTYEWADTTVDDGYENTAPVGSYQDGASWVGALDMSGNVWEWVSSIYEPYPYDATDGREVDGSSDSSSARGLRGSSWLNESGDVRATNRYSFKPSDSYDIVGFRCARSY
jgi:formylglycine-generating enzyme required for sulfatase activity/tRNA A-37 threonylcarbamoyl transferase component Bud32